MKAEALDLETSDEPESPFGDEFSDLFHWVVENDFADLFELLYYAFCQSEILIDPLRIYAEIDQKHSANILASWDDDALAARVYDFYQRLKNTPSLLSKYKPISKVNRSEAARRQARKSKLPLVERGYLLALSYKELFSTDREKDIYYQSMLRIWVYIHSLTRLQFYSANDSLTSVAARYLISDEKELIKISLLKRFFDALDLNLSNYEPSFNECNFQIGAIAEALGQQLEDQLGKEEKEFLASVVKISRYESELISQAKNNTLVFVFKRSIQHSNELYLEPFFSSESGIKFSENYRKTDNEFSEDAPTFLEIEVSEEQTQAEQIVTSTGVFIQRAEQAHYIPWSWDKVLPAEIESFQAWLSQTISSPHPTTALAGALIWLAFKFGRSLETVLTLNIGDEAASEWTLAPSFGVIRRRSLRRHSAYRPNTEAQEWLNPVGEVIEIKLPIFIKNALRGIQQKENQSAKQLAQLWQITGEPSLFQWFNSHKSVVLGRISSGMLTNALRQDMFNKTQDSSFSRIWASNPRHALPAACGYGSWDIEPVLNNENPLSSIKNSPKVSFVGSMLLPKDNALKNYFAELFNAIECATTFVEFHNAITHYTALALQAALGTRYLSTPFETLKHFYLSEGKNAFPSCVYVNDKQDDIHDGRLIPLCGAAEAILLRYLEHLKHLSKSLEDAAPNLSSRISAILNKEEAQQPLFFLLDERLKWHTFSNKSLLEMLPQWPLPANTLRHRFSQRMTELGLPSDVLEAWMGHGERGVACYGDYSPRCWQADAIEYMPLIDSMVSALDLKAPKLRTNLSIELGVGFVEPDSTLSVFGAKARQLKRDNTLTLIKEIASEKIASFLAGRTWADIDAEKFEQFVKDFTQAEGNLIAQSYPLERLDILYKSLEDAESPLIRLIKKRIVSLQQERSRLTPKVLDALQQLPAIQAWALTAKESLYNCSISLRQSAQFGVVLFAIEKQVSYLQLLNDMTESKNFVLVQYGKECFLRYSEDLAENDYQTAAQHHQISYKTASFLDAFKGAKNTINSGGELAHALLTELAELLGLPTTCSFDELLKRLCIVIGQANLVTLPGVVAAGLSERQPPTSLSLQDYARVKFGKALALPDLSNSLSGKDDQLLQVPITTDWMSQESEQLKENAYDYHKELQAIINQYEKAQAKEVAKQIGRINKQYAKKVSSAVLGVGFWIANVILTGKFQGRRKTFTPLAANSTITYYGTLMAAFRELAYDVDLFSLSEDEFYELYTKMVEYKRGKEQDTEYFARRLVSYHSLFLNQGLPEFDWGELDFINKRRSVSSGFITDKDYQATLKRLEQKYNNQHQASLLQFILLLTYRFGLRVQEATHLLRKDWNENKNGTWVLVRNNKYRKLKSEHGRRAVPLVFDLSNIENKIIQNIFGRHTLIANSKPDSLILSEIKDGELVLNPLCYRASAEIIKALREVTGNQQLVLHHARHSFLNQLAAVIYRIDTPLTKKITKGLEHDKVLKNLMGPATNNDRRSSMALSVVMGHAHPTTSLKSYNHLITDWADKVIPIEAGKTHRLKTAIHLNEWESWAVPKIEKQEAIEFTPPTIQTLTELMRYIALGKTFLQATNILGLEAIHAESLENIFYQAVAKNPVPEVNQDEHLKLQAIRKFLAHIPESAWLRLLSSLHKEWQPTASIELSCEELPLLIGGRRQLLMCTSNHYQLAKQVIDYFELPEDCYSVSAYQNSTVAKSKLAKHSFDEHLLDTEKSIDLMTWFMAGGTVGLHRDYAAFWLKDRVTTPLRTSYEIVLMSLIMGYLFTIKS